MILKYGTYAHKIGSVAITMRKERILDDAGIVEGFRHVWDLAGLLTTQENAIADARADIKAQIAALETAYATDGQNLILYFPDGVTQSAHALLTANTRGGVRVVNGPNYSSGAVENVTIRRYQISVEAEIPVSASDRHSALVSFFEELDFAPAGAKFGFLETPNGRPIKQQLRRFQTYQVTQSGGAVGRDAYPLIPAPIWPFALADAEPLISKGHPQRVGSSWKNWPISWTYLYKSNIRLSGDPHVWGLTYLA